MSGVAAAQAPGSADPNPTSPPTAPVPVFVNAATALSSGGAGAAFDDVGTGRGLALVDVVGPDPSAPDDPTKVGPPDGILDVVQTNSNSPALPYGSDASTWIVPPIGTTHHDCRVWRGRSDGTFQDVAAAMSPSEPDGWNLANPGGSPWGVIGGDVDGDGDTDLFYVCGGFNTASANALMRNEGDGTFTNATTSAGLAAHAPQASFGATLLDHDLDGDLDLYVANGGKMFDVYWSGPSHVDTVDRLYENDDAGAFVDVAPAARVDLKSMSFSVAAGDLDRNGRSDLVVSCFKQWNKVFYSNSDGSYALMAPAANPSFAYDLSMLAPDPQYPGHDFPSVDPAHLAVLPLLGEWSMPIQLADFNGDGWLDVANVCWSNQLLDSDPTSAVGAQFNPFERSYLYLNRGDQDGDGLGDGEFRECGAEVGFDHVGGAMGFLVADVNGDGTNDVYVGGGGPDFAKHFEEDYLYLNEPTAWPTDWLADPDQPLAQAFFEVGALAGTYANTEMSHGVAATLRTDGAGARRVDLIVGNGGPAQLDAGQANVWWRNDGDPGGQAYAVCEVSLNASLSAPGGVGARVELIRDAAPAPGGPGGPSVIGRLLAQERSAGRAFASHDGGPLLFGLGDGGLLFSQVRWPSGVHQGRLNWFFDPQPSAQTFVEPTTSISLRASYGTGGAMTLSAELSQHGATPWFGHLYFLSLTEVAPGAFAPAALLPAALGITLQPGAPLHLSAPLASPATGLYALALVDGATFEVANAAAVWHEPALLLPATWTPPSTSIGSASMGSASVEERAPVGRRFHPVRRALTASPERVEIAPARVPLEWRALREGEALALAGGDRLALEHGRLTVAIEGPFEGTLDLAPGPEPGVALLTLGGEAGCCETLPRSAETTLVRITGARELRVDERAPIAPARR